MPLELDFKTAGGCDARGHALSAAFAILRQVALTVRTYHTPFSGVKTTGVPGAGAPLSLSSGTDTATMTPSMLPG